MQVDGVFEGGGVRGIALAGAAAGAMDAGYEFRRVAGTSAGAMVAALVAAGYRAEELRSAVCKANWPGLLDPTIFTRVPAVGKHLSLVLRKGIYKGRAMERTWSDLLADKGVRTFADLPDGVLQVVATDITHQRGVVLPYGLERYGIDSRTFSVARAVRMSASVPFLFVPVALMHQHAAGETVLLADGAMASRFPLEVMQPPEDRPIVGFRLADFGSPHDHAPIRGPITLAGAVIGAGMSARETLPRLALEPGRVIDVPAERDSLDFDLTSDEAREMFDIGRATTRAWFARHNPETPSVRLRWV